METHWLLLTPSSDLSRLLATLFVVWESSSFSLFLSQLYQAYHSAEVRLLLQLFSVIMRNPNGLYPEA